MKRKLLFIQLSPSSFIRKDEAILRRHFEVKTFIFRHRKGIRILPELVRQLFFLLKNIYSADILYIWFADFHAVLPSLFSKLWKKKCVIVIGGVDAAYDPELKYGTKNKLAGKISLYLSTRWAQLLLPVTRHTREKLLHNISSNLASKSVVVHNCFDASFQNNPENASRSKAVITICLASSVKTLLVKGIDFLLKVAATMPDATFTIVGLQGEARQWVLSRKSGNVAVHEPVDHHQLSAFYQQASVICQFSRHESFGIAMLEGIASGCFPVGHRTGGIAEILADSNGLLIDRLDIDEGREAIRQAFQKDHNEQKLLKTSVLEKFSCQKRELQLLALL